MWQGGNSFSPESIVWEFCDFLESPAYLKWSESQNNYDQRSITLADALQGWLETGNGIAFFHTYTSFLVTVIMILDEFTMSGVGAIGDVYVDPINKGRVHVFPLLDVNDRTSDFSAGFTYIGRTMFHPIMQQHYFETLRARGAQST